ncbi:hypothetical protein [Actinoplanes sp. TFC3]|uniref:hypothetical protein n=1 Tax=Actinoplanes sp. TFC3 TaxID=1710355 RepID=UPI00129008D2|nr:hypothetical protein [Actinoplanes sp. TFC3]
MDLIVGLTTFFTLGSGVLTYVIARRDVRRRAAVAVAVTTALLVGLGFLFTVYLAVVAYLGAVVVWLVARRVLPSRRMALLAGAGALGVALTGAVVVMGYALSNMN